ncbi:DEAD/DEAH box helicase [Melissococcus plutonius]|uniref:DEAD-box ATP-dependent RNA helicase CshB n=1 Tax=Melissococcus plutonius (strain ATCC 35311 / DSM 29964 / CIP 104052 / LMG 20360 / NCIMB 702443) TaxID=940190 RepID=F3YA86_MELPT|nr:DEAD/DEAH box helicase [Melissococcus plutonius]AIM24908.1 DEAD-box ATP-dependent RNA helicase CshB [Melissococcus plutonius S1]KMT25046.1 DEAD-box ATP-dependent RNA helicase CshB [Melissococcus plutonius]KMT26683.1 DEAD-box ATP-dependent RNA helicase CshB [Melissococcus plutonius]KMT27933.1 DEAD-box ATP-dependent RNA helicase CshB [Melissococcus plutonius]KMT29706.1 DEAD-box ATP-dependent RNA helicase CshB [Melissococcus plutonius]
MSSFKQFQFKPFLMEALKEKGFQQPTQVQEKLIQMIQKGKNVIGQSQTGSGKTHTFLLPLLNKIDPTIDEVQVIITTPSRELANQIYQAAIQAAKFSSPEIHISNFIGGTDKQRQLIKLKNQQPQLVVGTPGRILDMINEQALKVHTAFAFVIDEADMTLDMGFLEDVDQIASRLPKNLQMLVFSATIPEKLRPFLKKYLENPVIEEIKSETVIASTIDNWLFSTKGKDVNQLVYQLLTIGHPYLAIIFANTKQRVDEITTYLKEHGLRVAKIHGDISPRERKRVMRQVQNLEYQYVVATDLAARGIDIEGVSEVINTEIPKDLDFFIHRVGRTGRNGLKGTAITLYSPADEQQITEIEKLGITFQPKEIKNGEIIATYDRNRRLKREKTQDELDPILIGLVKKKQKKIKPGYKKKIERAITDSNKQKRKVERRQANRTAKKAKKRSSN